MALIDFTDAALPGGADTAANPGGPGLTTSARTNQTALAAAGQDAFLGTVVAPGAIGTPAEHPIPWWLAIIVALVIWHYFDMRGPAEGTRSEIKIGVGNALKICVMLLPTIALLKWIFGIYKVPGLSALIEMV